MKMHFHVFLLFSGILYCYGFDLNDFLFAKTNLSVVRNGSIPKCAKKMPLIFLPVVIKVFRWPDIELQNETRKKKKAARRKFSMPLAELASLGAGELLRNELMKQFHNHSL